MKIEHILDVLEIGAPAALDDSLEIMEDYLLDPKEKILHWSAFETSSCPETSGTTNFQASKPFASHGATAQLITFTDGRICIALFGTLLHFDKYFMCPDEPSLSLQLNSSLLCPKKISLYDVEKQQWLLPHQSGSIPEARAGQSVVLLPDQNNIWTFGGLYYNKIIKEIECLNDVSSWNIKTGEWKILSQQHKRRRSIECHPERRFKSGALLLKNRNEILLYGGRSLTQIFDDLWIWSISSSHWTRFNNTFGIPPIPSYGHQMLKYGEDIIVIRGGSNSIDEKPNKALGQNPIKRLLVELLDDNQYSDVIYERENVKILFDLNQSRWIAPNQWIHEDFVPRRSSVSMNGVSYGYLVSFNLDGKICPLMKVDTWLWSLPTLTIERTLIKSFVSLCNISIFNRIADLKHVLSTCSSVERDIYAICIKKLESILSSETIEGTSSCHLLINVNNQLIWLSSEAEEAEILLLLNLELEGRHKTRKDDELYRSKRRFEILQNHENLKRKAFESREENMKIAAQIQKEEQERNEMTLEDFISGLPLKNKISPPRCKCIGNGKIFIKWAELTLNSRGYQIESENIIYRLFTRGGHFQPKSDKLSKFLMKRMTESTCENIYSRRGNRDKFNAFDALISDCDNDLRDTIRNIKKVSWENEWKLVLCERGKTNYLHSVISEFDRETESGSVVIQYMLDAIGADEPVYEPSKPSQIETLIYHWGEIPESACKIKQKNECIVKDRILESFGRGLHFH